MSTFDDGYHAGKMSERVNEHDRRLNAINGSIDRSEQAQLQLTATVADLARKVEGIGSKVGVYASIGAFVASVIGSVVTGVVVYALTH